MRGNAAQGTRGRENMRGNSYGNAGVAGAAGGAVNDRVAAAESGTAKGGIDFSIESAVVRPLGGAEAREQFALDLRRKIGAGHRPRQIKLQGVTDAGRNDRHVPI